MSSPRARTKERYLLAGLLLLQSALLTWIVWWAAPTWDEWGHLPSGLYHLQHGRFEPYCVNPPLVRMLAALPVLIAGGGISEIEFPPPPVSRPEWLLARNYVFAYRESCFFWISLARTGLIPLSILGTYLLWRIGRQWYGSASGWVAAWLWCFSPMSLTFGATLAPDVAAAVFCLWATYRFYLWLRLLTWNSMFVFSSATALALLSKSTCLILPPIFVILWAADRIRYRRMPGRMEYAQLWTGLVFGWLVIHAAYGFQGMLRPLGDFTFCSRTFTGNPGATANEPVVPGNRFAGTWLGRLPAILPAAYVQGIDLQKAEFEKGYPSYLCGTWRNRGWWYYYLFGIVFKEPIALWCLTALLLAGSLQRGTPRIRWREVMLYLPGIAVLVFVSSQTGFSHHLRYVLPFYPCLYLLHARSAAARSNLLRYAVAACCLWYAASSVSILPRSYAFFSEAIGGSDQGHRYLTDSNLDWGQDLTTLRTWARRNPDKKPLWLLYEPSWLDFRSLGMEATQGSLDPVQKRPAVAGWWAVFAFPMTREEAAWFRNHDPLIHLSPTVRIYHVTEEDLQRTDPRSPPTRSLTTDPGRWEPD